MPQRSYLVRSLCYCRYNVLNPKQTPEVHISITDHSVAQTVGEICKCYDIHSRNHVAHTSPMLVWSFAVHLFWRLKFQHSEVLLVKYLSAEDSCLLQYARDFENVLLNPKDGMGKPITWGNSVALEGYVRRLQQVAEQLKQKNRWLLPAFSTTLHAQCSGSVIQYKMRPPCYTFTHVHAVKLRLRPCVALGRNQW